MSVAMPPFPAPRFVETDELRMAVFEEGAGVPVVLCHGFPEIAYSWRHQLPALAKAGCRAIAPDMRGYGKTGAPATPPTGEAAVPLYDMAHLTGDMVQLLDALKIEKAVFCGHDWGGIAVWQMPLRHPDRVMGVIGVNTPFLPRMDTDPVAAMRAAMGDEMYMVYFQKYGVAEASLEKDVSKTIRFFFRKGGTTRADFDKLPKERRNLAFMRAFEADEADWGGKPLLSPEEAAVYVRAFERTGFTGPINWYRNLTRNWETSTDIKEHIACPCLMISAQDDVVLRPEMADGMERYAPDLEKHIIPACGHWTQKEKPDALNALMTDWLSRRIIPNA